MEGIGGLMVVGSFFTLDLFGVVVKGTRVWFEWIFLWMNMRKRYWSLLKVALWVCPPSKYIGAGGQKPEGLCSLLLRKIGGTCQATTPGLLNSNTVNPLQVRSLEKYPSLVLRYLFWEGLHNLLSGFCRKQNLCCRLCLLLLLDYILTYLRALATQTCPSEKTLFAFSPKTSFFF